MVWATERETNEIEQKYIPKIVWRAKGTADIVTMIDYWSQNLDI